MSKRLLPQHNKQFTSFNSNLDFNQTINQINTLNNNKIDNLIRQNILYPSIYNNSEEQFINANNKYTQDKLNYLNEHKKQYVDQVDEEDLYNPFIEYDKQRNLIQNKLIQFYDYYVEINSRNREKDIKINIETEYNLEPNPLQLTKDSNKVYLNVSTDELKQDDKIMIQGISVPTYTIQYSILEPSNNTLIFKEGTKYAMIKFNHGLNNLSKTEYYCSIENLTNPPNNTYIGNIPLTFINSTHKIILSVSEDLIFNDGEQDYPAVYSPDRFYIDFPYKYIPGTIEEGTINSSMTRNFNLKMFYINSIPIYELNAGYPQTEYQQNMYYNINVDENNKYYININTKAYWLSDNNTLNIGGDNVKIIKIKNIEYNDAKPNCYTIKLPRSFKNIIKVEIVGSEFPNIENNVYKIKNDEYDSNDFLSQEYFQNNKLYWQNYLDGQDYTYSIEIPPGKYTPEKLKETIEKLVYDLPRVYYLKQQYIDQDYTIHNVMNVDFDINQNKSTFKMFTEYIFIHAIKGLFYIHNEKETRTQQFIRIKNKKDLPKGQLREQSNPLFLLIECQDHDKNVNNTYNRKNGEEIVRGDTFEIVDIENYMNIPGRLINGVHEMYKTPDKMYDYVIDNNQQGRLEEIILDPPLNYLDYFMIKLPDVDILDKYVPDTIEENNEGGVFIGKLQLKFRMLFNTNDNIGEMLGFSNIGQQNSITEWGYEINNQQPYKSNTDIDITNNVETYLNFNGENYINIVCSEFPVFENIIGIDNIFAKILISEDFNKVCYNTFINNVKYFLTPINEINSLTFRFYNSRNMLCNFGNVNHSFVIKITTLNASQLRTNLSSYTGTQI